MVCTSFKFADLLKRPFSAAVSFQKQFVGDVVNSLRAQEDRHKRRNRDFQERAIQLHLDSLETKYLCCVCLAPGEKRDSVAQADNAFVMVELPPQEAIEAAIIKTKEVLDTRSPVFSSQTDARGCPPKSASYNFGTKGSVMGNSSSTVHQTDAIRKLCRRNSASGSLSDEDSISSNEGKGVNSREWSAPRFSEGYRRGDALNPSPKTGVAFASRKKPIPEVSAALDPEQVPSIEVKNMIYRIHNFFIKKRVHETLHTAEPIRDKGLVMIEDSDIELFSYFFQRPVRGYLCERCCASVLKSLDALSRHIQTILFKAKHPLLRKTHSKEIEQFLSAKPTSLVSGKYLLSSLHQPLESDYASKGGNPDVAAAWFHLGGRVSLRTATQQSRATGVTPKSISRLSSDRKVNAPDHTILDDDTILSLRATVKCGVCQKRACSFFVQVNTLFICEFCCAWDRFYRDHAICINDEEMPLKCACLLTELCAHYKQIHIQKELREMPQTELQIAPRSLFLPEENIFEIQNLPSTHEMPREVAEITISENRHIVTTPPVVEERPIYKKEARADSYNLRDFVGNTRLSLFTDTCIKQRGEPDLFESVVTKPQTELLKIDPAGKPPQTNGDASVSHSPDQKDISLLFK